MKKYDFVELLQLCRYLINLCFSSIFPSIFKFTINGANVSVTVARTIASVA